MIISAPQIYRASVGSSQLHRYLKKHFVEDIPHFERIMDNIPEAKRVVGTMPPEWIEGVDKKELRKLTKLVSTLCSKFAHNIAEVDRSLAQECFRHDQISLTSSRPNSEVGEIMNIISELVEGNGWSTVKENHKKFLSKSSERFEPAIRQFQSILSKLLKKDVKLSELSRGCHGRTFLIDVNGQKTVFKTFMEEVPEDYYGDHGKVAEVARAPFVKRHTADNKFARFFMGKLSKRDVGDDAFMILRYIDDKTPARHDSLMHQSVFDHVYTPDADSVGNRIRSVIVDYGGLKINSELLSKDKIKFARLLKKAFVEQNMPLFYKLIEENYESKEFQELLSFIKEKLNKEIMKQGAFYTSPKSLRMYEVLGLRFHPDEKQFMCAEDVALCEKYNLFDEAQTLRLNREPFRIFNI